MILLFKKKSLLLFWPFCFLFQDAKVYADTLRTVSPEQWQQLTSDKAFGYKNDVENIPPPEDFEPSLIQKFFGAIQSFFSSPAGRMLVWLFLVSVAVYIIYRLFLSSDSFVFGKNKKLMKDTDTTPETNEDISATDWEALLQNARGKNDLRLAVRYSYMLLLQLLQQHGLIRYRMDKTNYEYLTELNETQYKQAFRQLSRQYEYTWYGMFEISGAKFNEYMGLFNKTREQIVS